jgi:hypothetical protein
MERIIESINVDEDQIKLFFGCKALSNILVISTPELRSRIIKRFGSRLVKRLVHILNYEHMEELMTEALKCTLLLVNGQDSFFNRELVFVGIVPTLCKYMACKVD